MSGSVEPRHFGHVVLVGTGGQGLTELEDQSLLNIFLAEIRMVWLNRIEELRAHRRYASEELSYGYRSRKSSPGNISLGSNLLE